ncbi:hypothetical protein ACFFU8_09575 [Chromobacterium piscinae]|uniref:hypothetical protein n=1 Tax=Chromobacterium piscinae TaxID=686831 RepID=UPI001E575F8C|nr:hypothetical protein [Chromobacterium piscinae]MCD5327846.1 hypothetical protein [Chromobacterium piscinae]
MSYAKLACQSGRWKGSTGGFNGHYLNLGSTVGTYTSFNTSDKALAVFATGGNSTSGGQCGNRYDLGANIAGIGRVATNSTANDNYSKTGFLSFFVPAKTQFSIESYPWGCGPGIFSAYAFIVE